VARLVVRRFLSRDVHRIVPRTHQNRPDIVVERVTWHAGVMQWDKPIVTWLMLGPMVACLVAGLDARRNGIDPTKSKIFLGYVLAIAGSALTLAAMTVNRFYTPVVRIQSERGHKVAESGPYRVVRHPGNLGNVVLNVATPLMLASHWAWIPAGLSILLIILRTTMEDRMLRLELPGYREFAQRTRSRLLPGVW
jgi:protein-S-isoprenylcysteine O-methyltransferase Ste14